MGAVGLAAPLYLAGLLASEGGGEGMGTNSAVAPSSRAFSCAPNPNPDPMPVGGNMGERLIQLVLYHRRGGTKNGS